MMTVMTVVIILHLGISTFGYVFSPKLEWKLFADRILLVSAHLEELIPGQKLAVSHMMKTGFTYREGQRTLKVALPYSL